jgi:hypothetical protein
MKLTSVHVREYKSIQDSNRFEVGDVTCLVGKNEAGKTAVLEALSRLNPLIPTKTFDITDDYPRANVEEYQQELEQKKRKPTVVVNATFTLTDEEMQGPREEFGDDVFKSPSFDLSRGYSKTLYVGVEVDEKAAVHYLVKQVPLSHDVAAKANAKTTFKDLSAFLNARAIEQEAAFTKAQTEASALADAQDKAKALDDAKALAETEAAKHLRTKLLELQKQSFGIYVWETYLKESFRNSCISMSTTK